MTHRPNTALLGRLSAVAIVATTLVGASAADLGGVTGGVLSTYTYDVDIDIPPESCDTFDSGLLGTLLIATPASCGIGLWLTTGGNWQVSDGRLDVSTNFSSIAWFLTASRYASVEATVSGADATGAQGGVVVSYDALLGSHLRAVLVGPNRVELRRVTLGGSTVLGSATVPIPAEARLRLTRTTTQAIVSLDGVVLITVPIAGGSLPGLGVGLFHGGGPAVVFDDFLATAPSAP